MRDLGIGVNHLLEAAMPPSGAAPLPGLKAHAMTTEAVPRSAAVALRKDRGEWLLVVGPVVIAGWLLLTLAIPLAVLLIKSVQNSDGAFVGLANYARYIETCTNAGKQAKQARTFDLNQSVPKEYQKLSLRWIFWGVVATIPLLFALILMIGKPV